MKDEGDGPLIVDRDRDSVVVILWARQTLFFVPAGTSTF